MINVKVVDSKEKTYPKDLQSCKYYSCKSKKLHTRGVFVIVPAGGDSDKRIVIWLNSKYNNQGLGYDAYRDLIECHYDFRLEKDWYVPRKPKFTPYKRDHCPVCFKPYELIDNELVQTCFRPQNSNICGRCGMNNCSGH